MDKSRFDGVQTQVLGLSVDSVDSLKAWAESLGEITYPLLSDFWPHGRVARLYGVLRSDGRSERALFIVDKSGIIRYVDVHDIDLQPDNEVLFEVLARIEGVPVPPRDEPPPAPAPSAVTPQPDAAVEVTMYCTPWCPGCRRARLFFQENNIRYREIDITKDRSAAALVRSYAGGYETTPTFDVKGKILIEFNRAQLAEALGIEEHRNTY